MTGDPKQNSLEHYLEIFICRLFLFLNARAITRSLFYFCYAYILAKKQSLFGSVQSIHVGILIYMGLGRELASWPVM